MSGIKNDNKIKRMSQHNLFLKVDYFVSTVTQTILFFS